MDATTLVFALLAVFVIWKLRSVLGTRTGHEQPPVDVYRRKTEDAPEGNDSTVVRFPTNTPGVPEQGDLEDRRASWARIPGLEAGAIPGLEAIASADMQFEPKTFIEGAKAAYEMIVMSFAAGNRTVLGDLLSKDVLDSFSSAITDRESRGETVDSTFVSIDRAAVQEAQLRAGTAQITLRFQSKLISATRNKAGEVVDGNPDKVVDIVDIWTFSRDTKSQDPSWFLVATEAGA